MKTKHRYIISGLIVACLIFLFAYNTFIGLPGSDDGAETLVQSISPNYRPWIESFGLELNATTETLLFITQIALGLLLLVYCLHLLRKKKTA